MYVCGKEIKKNILDISKGLFVIQVQKYFHGYVFNISLMIYSSMVSP